jgi:heat shock protein HslJ
MGSYQTKESNQLALSSAATTMMMCIDMETETNFLKALGMVDSYLVQNDTLTLRQDGTTTLARFVAVYLR